MTEYLQSLQLLTDDEINAFVRQLSLKRISKGDFFIREGAICKEVAFITSGAVRSYYYSSTDEEVTYCFTFAGSFLTAYSSFLTQSPTAENIQALTDLEVYTISRNAVLELEASSTNWLRFLKHVAEQEFIKMEKRVFMLQKESAEKRYEDLMQHQPELLQLIPLQYLSSYLGITQRHLSRIRKGLSN